jgi:hypothetical protein
LVDGGGGRWSTAVQEFSYGTMEEGERERWSKSKKGGARVKPTIEGGWRRTGGSLWHGGATRKVMCLENQREGDCSGSSPKRGVW